jgi:hypothetical protein
MPLSPDTLAGVGGSEGAKQVSDSEPSAWTGEGAELPKRTDERLLEEQLILRDRIAGLEAQLAELGTGPRRYPTDILSAEQRIIVMQSSLAWRLGSVLTNPRRLLRHIFRR